MNAEPEREPVPTVLISWLKSKRDNEPRSDVLGWPRLVATLSTVRQTSCTVADCAHNECPHKNGLAWSPATYPSGATRKKKLVSALSVLVIDLDHLTDERLAAAAARLEPYRRIMHASHSDRPGDRCMRAVVALSRPVTANEWPTFWPAAMADLGQPADPSCCDANRLYYLPSRPNDADFEFGAFDGCELDVDAIITKAAQPSLDVNGRVVSPTVRAIKLDETGTAGPGGRHALLKSLAGAMRARGAGEVEIEQALKHANTNRCNPPKPDDEVHDIAAWAAQQPISSGPKISHRVPPDEDIPHAAESYGLPAGLTVVDEKKRDASAPSGTESSGQPTKPPATSILVVEAARLETPPIRSYSTGIPQLDNLIGGGVNTRELLVALGPPGAGKTAWAMSTALVVQRVLPCLYASTELEQHELMARAAANLLGCSVAAIRRGAVDRARVIEVLDAVQIRLLGCDVLPRDGSAAMKLIESEALRMADELMQPPLVLIDYLQDLARGAERDLRSRVGDLASEARAMAQRLDCPLVGISSVARTYYSARKAAEFREADDPTVYLAAAKESGDVDYAAARVLFLDVEADDGKPERPARIAVAKSRDGRVGFAGARLVGESGRWIPSPEAIGELSAPGRATAGADESAKAADEKVFAAVIKMHANGERELCTYSQLKTRCGIGTDRVRPALDRLVHVRRLRLVEIERAEGETLKRRSIYEPSVPENR